MAIYGIIVKDTLVKAIAVKADSLDEAIDLVNNAHENEEILLDYRDYDGEYKIEISSLANPDGTLTEENAKLFCDKLNF